MAAAATFLPDIEQSSYVKISHNFVDEDGHKMMLHGTFVDPTNDNELGAVIARRLWRFNRVTVAVSMEPPLIAFNCETPYFAATDTTPEMDVVALNGMYVESVRVRAPLSF